MQTEKNALKEIKEVIENKLCWSKEKARACFDETIIHEYHLEKAFEAIEYPVYVPKGDILYVLHCIYPELDIHYEAETIEVYKKVINKEIKQFPRDFFNPTRSSYALLRFRICLKYIVEAFHPVENVDAMYQFFLSSKGNKVLEHYRLKTPIRFYQINLIDELYELTKHEEHAKFYYLYYKFKKEYKKL